ncbi:MAG TPA: histidine phosphatase family protein [Acidimicrobiales bacterium]|nr:histidine phosphatase family protein [Acidimicrobiales bacterium]
MLVLVRHGQTQVNAEGRLQGRLDVPLSELGRRQAASLASAVGDAARVVSSPLRRARETAEVFGLPVEVDERWVEMDYGDYDGRPLAEVPADLWEQWRADARYRPPGGESLAEVGERVRAACTELVGEAAERDVVVVSHVSPIKAAVAWALGARDESAWRMFLEVASVCRVGVGPHGPVLRSFNECSHLPR